MPMQTRTDQVHSYEFFLQRVVSGLVARESDPAELPFRRLGWSGFGSVMIAIVVCGIVAIVGLLVGGGNDAWTDGSSIIKEKGSETIYVYIDERLHPVTNLVSAQLIKPGADVVRVNSRSLEGVRRGATLGIVNAPNLPGNTGDLLTGPWTLCSQGPPEGVRDLEMVSVLGVGQDAVGGEWIVDDRAILVQDIDPDAPYFYVVWRGYRYQVDPDPEVDAEVLQALAIGGSEALPVSSAWLDALPEGQQLTLPPGDAPGQASTIAVDGDELLTGQVIQDNNRYYLVRLDGVDEITRLQAEIMDRFLGSDNSVEGQLPTDVVPGALPGPDVTNPPRDPPTFVSGVALSGSVCAGFAPGEFTPTVLVGGLLDPESVTTRISAEGTRLADYVNIEGGKAVLVQSLSAPGAGVAWHIVNDQGIRFSLPSADVANAFGYQASNGVQVFSGLVDLLPQGPALDPAVAAQPVSLGVAPPG